MKKIILIALSSFITTTAFAAQLCPSETAVKFGTFTAPDGWRTTF